MVICSCNVVTEKEVRDYLKLWSEGGAICGRPSVNNVLHGIGRETACARCTITVKRMIKEHFDGNSNLFGR